MASVHELSNVEAVPPPSVDSPSDAKTSCQSPTPPQSVSIVIPTYNEAENVVEVIQRCRTALIEHPTELLIVDDDSPDETWRIVEDEYGDTRNVRVIRRTEERGLSTAVTRGFREALFDICVVLDADLQHPPERIPDLVESFESETDLVIASRYVEGGGVEQWPIKRWLVSRGATFVTKAFLPTVRRVADPLSGFFAIRRELLEDTDFSPLGYKILLELLIRCDCQSVEEIPYVFSERRRGDSKLAVDEYVKFIRHVVRLNGRQREGIPVG